MINVKIYTSGNIPITINLTDFFKSNYYPLNYEPVLKEINKHKGFGKQLCVFHTDEVLNNFANIFESPSDVISFLIENKKEDEELKIISIEDSFYISINKVVFLIYLK